jgi:hypothetical protein
VRSLFLLTAADAHPLVVPRVQARLATQFGSDAVAGRVWSAYWFRESLVAYEVQVAQGATAAMGRCSALPTLGWQATTLVRRVSVLDCTSFPELLPWAIPCWRSLNSLLHTRASNSERLKAEKSLKKCVGDTTRNKDGRY